MGKTAGRKKRIIITTAAMLAIGGGAAFAYWTAAGTFDAKTNAGDSTAFTVVSEAPTGIPLSPGAAAQTVKVTVTNPGTGVQKLQSVVVSVAGDNASRWTKAVGELTCSASDFAVGKFTVDNINDFSGAEVPANGTVTGTVTLQMKNSNTNQDACKNAEVPLHVVAS
jgi:hypothetical protein